MPARANRLPLILAALIVSFGLRGFAQSGSSPWQTPAPRCASALNEHLGCGRLVVGSVSSQLSLAEWDKQRKPGARQDNDGSNVTRTIQATFAVKQLQRGTPLAGKWERWKLECSDKPGRRDCWLDRLRIQATDLGTNGPLIWQEQFNTVEKTISALRMDWASGTLSFDFSLTPQRPDLAPQTHVEVLVSEEHGVLYLKSFHAVGSGRDVKGNLSAFDYAIPSDTVTLNVPLIMPGMSTR